MTTASWTSLNPLSGETTWSRGQAGQAAMPEVAGEAVLTFAAVEGGTYRLSILDAADGSVNGCLPVMCTGPARSSGAATPNSAGGRRR